MSVLEDGWWECREFFLGVCPCHQVSIVCVLEVDKGGGSPEGGGVLFGVQDAYQVLVIEFEIVIFYEVNDFYDREDCVWGHRERWFWNHNNG